MNGLEEQKCTNRGDLGWLQSPKVIGNVTIRYTA